MKLNDLSIGGILTALFVLALPFVTSVGHIIYGDVNTKFFFSLLFVLILSLYFIYLLFRGKVKIKIKNRPLLYILLGVLVIFYLSTFLGVSPERSLWSDILRSTGVLFLTAIAIASFVLGELLKEKDWSLVRRSIAVSSTVFAITTFFTVGNLGLSFGNSTFAGAYLLLGFVITLIELFRFDKGSFGRKSFWALAIIQFTSPIFLGFKELFLNLSEISGPILFIGTRGASEAISLIGAARSSGATIVLLVAYLVGLYIISRFIKNKKVTITWIVGFFVAIAILVGALFVPGSIVQEKYVESSTAARIIIWESSFEAFKERPVLGWGPENFRMPFEKYFDNRLHLEENIGEVWFDKAHNGFVDTLVSVGIVGLLSVITLVAYFIYVVYRAAKRGIIKSPEAHILGTIFLFHFLQIQTSFDTPATFAILGLIIGYGLWLEKEMLPEEVVKGIPHLEKIVAGVLLIIVLLGANSLLLGEYNRQRSIQKVFQSTSTTEQDQAINNVFKNKIDFESLRLTSNSLIKGFMAQLGQASTPEDRARIVSIATNQLNIYETQYVRYLEQDPNDYRARMNYVHLLLTKSILGEPRIDEAKEIIANSYELSRDNPLTYVLDSLAHLYGGDVVGAKEKIEEGIALNPEIEFTQNVGAYIDAQIKRAPNIAVLSIENL